MKIFVFHGGKEQLMVRVDNDRNVSINYPPIFGAEFLGMDTIAEKVDEDTKAKIEEFEKTKNNYSEQEFKEYIIKEFTTGQWAGFQLANIIEK